MVIARVSALLASCWLAGLALGYGAVPIPLTRGLLARWERAPAPACPSPASAEAQNTQVAPAALVGAETNELTRLRSPEFALFGERVGAHRPQTSHPAAVCGTGPDRRMCAADSADEPAADTSWMNGLRAPDLPVHGGVRVERFFRYLTESTAGRKMFRAWLKRSGRYRDVVTSALRERGLPEDLEAVVFIESGYSPAAVSSEGAVGLWQFMAGTARIYGLAVDDDYDERRNVEKATQAATRYLSELYERFGTWELALAAYDMGYGRLNNRVQELSTNDYWTLSLVPNAIPDEALSYVPKVIAMALVLRNLDRFGFDDVAQDAPLQGVAFEVPGGTPLPLLARAAGTSVKHLIELNPALLTRTVPERGKPATLLLPSTGVARANAMLPRLLARFHPDPAADRVDDHFDWGSDELLPAPAPRPVNPIGDPWMAAVTPSPSPDAASEDPPGSGDADPEPSRSGDVPEPAAATVLVFYRVDRGETPDSIARAFGVRPAAIVADNRLDPAAKLVKGMLLKLRVPRGSLSRLASERSFDDSQYAPPVRSDEEGTSDVSITTAPPALALTTKLHKPLTAVPATDLTPRRIRRLHGSRPDGRRSMADFPELFARKP